MRLIPATMATQHPDNAQAPYWERDGDGFVSVNEELMECLSCFQELKVKEFMWDWEGKYADEAVVDKLFTQYYDFFKKYQLGKDKFLTFRLPNIWYEKGYSLIRALMVILTSEDFAKDLKFHSPPLFEVILPLVERATQPIYIQSCFQKLARFKSQTFTHQRRNDHHDYLEVIPLVESVTSQINIGRLLDHYVSLHKKHFKHPPFYLRPFLARSDPALISGLLATVLANKIALHEIYSFAAREHVPVYPILGVGSLVFRGGLRPSCPQDFLKEYKGVRTVTIQSAFRYDFLLSQVKKAILFLNQKLAHSSVSVIKEKDIKILKSAVKKCEYYYQATVTRISKDLEIFFQAVPQRRERRLHIGLLAYRRQIGKRYFPRAIGFTAAMYSLGVPPEFIGLGQAFQEFSLKEREVVHNYYFNLRSDLQRAGHYLNRDNLVILSKSNRAWALIQKDITLLEKLLKIKLGPRTPNDFLHQNLTNNVLLLRKKKETVRQLMIETGKIRHSLG